MEGILWLPQKGPIGMYDGGYDFVTLHRTYRHCMMEGMICYLRKDLLGLYVGGYDCVTSYRTYGGCMIEGMTSLPHTRHIVVV